MTLKVILKWLRLITKIIKTYVDTFGMILEVIWRPYNFDFFSNCVILLLSFSYYLTILIHWYGSLHSGILLNLDTSVTMSHLLKI